MTVFPWGAFVAMQTANNNRRREAKELEEDLEKYNHQEVFFYAGGDERKGTVVDVYKGHALKIESQDEIFKRYTHQVDFYPADVRYTARVFYEYHQSMKEILDCVEDKEQLAKKEKDFYDSVRVAKQAFDKYFDL